MMEHRILERSAIGLERFITGFANSRPNRDGMLTATVPWSHHTHRFTRAEIPGLIRQTRAVLQSIALHAASAPAWAIPLPLDDELHPLLQARGPMHLLGLFGCSLMMMNYDYPAHPSFSTFGSGVMAHAWTPDHVRDDRELQAEFPAIPLPGLSERLVWHGEGLPVEVLAGLLGH